MAEIALIVALGAVGYALAKNDIPSMEGFSTRPRPLEQHTDDVSHSDAKGHSNEVPFFGARVTQSMYSGATDHVLDNHTGAGKEYFQKRENLSFYDTKPGTGNPFGNQVETDFQQSRMVTSMQTNNVFPIEQTLVGAPGSNAGYTNEGQGGFQQDQLREWALPPTTDELRIASKPKLTFTSDPVPGVNQITQPGVQAPVVKNKPDKFALLGMDRANTAVGAQTAPMLYAEQPMRSQARETTSVQYFGSGGGQEGLWASYIRSFTEPFQEFMKLTAEGRPGPAAVQGSGQAVGSNMYSAQTRKDESVLSDASRFNAPKSAFTADSQHMRSIKYNEPLQQDVHIERNHPGILDALQNNPLALPLNAY
jgi:hypothetical protein